MEEGRVGGGGRGKKLGSTGGRSGIKWEGERSEEMGDWQTWRKEMGSRESGGRRWKK